MPKLRHKPKKTISIARNLTGKKPKALNGGTTKKQRELYKQLKSAIHPRKTKSKTNTAAAKQKINNSLNSNPTGNLRRKIKKIKTMAKPEKIRKPNAKLIEELYKKAIERFSYGRSRQSTLQYYKPDIERYIEARLKQKGFTEEVIKQTLNELWI